MARAKKRGTGKTESPKYFPRRGAVRDKKGK